MTPDEHKAKERERLRIYYHGHRQERIAYQTAYRLRHMDKVASYQKQYHADHTAAMRRYSTEWKKRNPVLNLAGESVFVRSLPEPLQEVALQIKEARRLIRSTPLKERTNG